MPPGVCLQLAVISSWRTGGLAQGAVSGEGWGGGRVCVFVKERERERERETDGYPIKDKTEDTTGWFCGHFSHACLFIDSGGV